MTSNNCSIRQAELLQRLDSIKAIVSDLDDDWAYILLMEIDSMLDELADEDFFGTERQMDPRNVQVDLVAKLPVPQQVVDCLPETEEALFFTTSKKWVIEETRRVRYLMQCAERDGDLPYYTHWLPLPPPIS